MSDSPYVSVERQLVVEVHVSDLARSMAIYGELGFGCRRSDLTFAVMTWERAELFLAQFPADTIVSGTQANVRIMVPDVDRYWALVAENGIDRRLPHWRSDLRVTRLHRPRPGRVRYSIRVLAWRAGAQLLVGWMMRYDVAIIGGGPAGSTVGSLLKRQIPTWNIGIFESAKFPRDHVGESLLPATCEVLAEIGAWEKVEAAEFPVKLGGLYRWGKTEGLYPLTFLRNEPYADKSRPAKYEDQRRLTAFQVDRSIFDKILLDHAAELGCEVFEESAVRKIEVDGDGVLGLEVATASGADERVEADWYIDASGNRAILRKAIGVGIEAPTSLRNIAIYDYWQNASWGTRHGTDATHILVMSLSYGWLWFIAMGKTRTSVGLVTSAEHYKRSGLSTEELYRKAISEEPLVSKLLEPAAREHVLRAESDWSYVADRLCGENWFLAGDACGFADPILSAGLTLAMTGAQKVAYSVTELSAGNLDRGWVKSEYDRIQRNNIRDHIRFADYWYSVNAKFTDLTEYCAEIARDAGLNLDPDEAFQWLGVGGFSTDAGGYQSPTTASFRLATVKSMIGSFGGASPSWQIKRYKRIRLNLEGAERELSASYYQGRVEPQESFRRGRIRLFLTGFTKRAYVVLLQEDRTPVVFDRIFQHFRGRYGASDGLLQASILEVLEAMLLGGWIEGVEE